MSGHSKWHSIKHKKAAVDAKRGKAFTKIIKELVVAARLGGGDPESNPRLRTIMDKARAINMPNDNIKKAIMRGTGELEGVNYEELSYEGYGPAGVAIIVEAMTDNKNRTVAEVRHTFDKYGGKMGEQGCVGWMFSRKGLILIDKETIQEDALMELVLENGAEDFKVEEDSYEVTCEVQDFNTLVDALKEKEIETLSAEISLIPSTEVKVESKQSASVLRLIEKLEDLDDTQNVWANFDISPEDIEAYNS